MKELYLVCPFSSAEFYIKEYINPSAYFYTSAGAVFSLDNEAHKNELKDIILSNGINRINIVGTNNCRFAKDVVDGKGLNQFFMYKKLKSIYKLNYTELSSYPRFIQAAELVKRNINYQKKMFADFIHQFLPEKDIEVSAKLLDESKFKSIVSARCSSHGEVA